MRPVSTISIAFALPTKRVKRCVPPEPGMTPSVISGWPNLAVSAAMMVSHIIAISQAPPSAQSAFNACGRLSVIRPTDPRVSTRMLLYAMTAVLFGKQCEGDPEVAVATAEIEMQRLGVSCPGLARSLPAELRQGRGVEAAHG